MRYNIFTPFLDDHTIDNESIRFIDVSNDVIDVYALNFNWDFIHITSTDYYTVPSGDTNLTVYVLRSGTFEAIKRENQPVWENMANNVVDHTGDDEAKSEWRKHYEREMDHNDNEDPPFTLLHLVPPKD